MKLRVPQLPAILDVNSSGWSPNRRRTREMVFSSTGDITRSKNSAGQNARSAILVRRTLLNRQVSAAAVRLQAAWSAALPYDCRRCGDPLRKISPLPVGAGSLDAMAGVPSDAQDLRGTFELAHLNQVAASSVLLLDDVFSTGITASALARVFGKARTKQVSLRIVARKLKNHARDFEAEPEGEFAVPAQ